MPQNLKRASNELFNRSPDEYVPTLQALWEHCQRQREEATDRWHSPRSIVPRVESGDLIVSLGDDGAFHMNDWSFGQFCRLAGVNKETVNRLSADTASRVLQETLPPGNKPLQLLTAGDVTRSIHGTQYTRLWNVELVSVLREFATDFQPPQKGFNGATGLYAGEQDMFCFLIDPTGWVEIDGQAFAPGLFCWNSEVGKRALGVQTFWFQQVCGNHIVWDATEVLDFSRKHTGNVHEALGEIRRIIEQLVARRDERRDGFARVIAKAMQEKFGDDADEVKKHLAQHGISRSLAKQATELAAQQGRFTIWTVVDALTRIARETKNAGDRTDAEQKASLLLENAT